MRDTRDHLRAVDVGLRERAPTRRHATPLQDSLLASRVVRRVAIPLEGVDEMERALLVEPLRVFDGREDRHVELPVEIVSVGRRVEAGLVERGGQEHERGDLALVQVRRADCGGRPHGRPHDSDALAVVLLRVHEPADGPPDVLREPGAKLRVEQPG